MSSIERFAYRLAAVAELEPRLQSALAPHLSDLDPIRQIIYTPRPYSIPRVRKIEEAMRAYRGRPPAAVLILTQARLLTAAVLDPPAEPTITVTPLADLLRLDFGAILLLGWLEWSWAAGGQLARHQVYFNTVGEQLLWELVTAMRRSIIAQSDLPAQMGQPKDEAFDDLPYKFANLVPNRLMLPEEQVLASVFQPTIWQRRLGLFKRRRGPATAVVLSREHLLVAQEDAPAAGAAYGMIARYCPRARLAAVTLTPEGEELGLDIALRWRSVEESWRVLFHPAAEPALRKLLAQLA